MRDLISYGYKQYAFLKLMQQIEDFMRELFLTFIAEEKRILADRAGYRQKFFVAGCPWDSRDGTLAMIESEVIVSIKRSVSEATVITAYKVPFYTSGEQSHRRRYHLNAAGDSWVIRIVEDECLACHGQGDENCIGCKGKHWLGSPLLKPS